MKISIFGLGYVGTVSAAILADQGNQVIGVDINQAKVDMIKQGKSPIIEQDIPEILEKVVNQSMLRATTDNIEAINSSDVSVVCVGTPSKKNGSANLEYIQKVMLNISSALEKKVKGHLIVLRSTVPPGTMEELVIPIFKGQENISFCYNPEFLREGTAVKDYYNPPYTVIACSDIFAENTMREYYSPIKAEFIVEKDYKIAESMKMINNAFHAVKTAFANEIKRYGESYGIDPHKIMELVCKDTKLNISPKYLRPGEAMGGSCLPKDVRSLIHLCQDSEVDAPLISSILQSNDAHIKNAIEKVEDTGSRKIGIIGLSFKQGTDDLRESQNVRLAEHLYGKGYEIKIYDPKVMIARLTGAKKAQIENRMPHLARLLTDDLEEVMKNEVIVLNHNVDIDQYICDYHKIVDLR